ncbi:MAG: flippase-like domain-containing protein [Polyangiaceae bacterium]|nr:flippase-like domain-containing protein [Polyangiaceae bacterium]
MRLVGPVLLLIVIVRMPDRGALLRVLASAEFWPLFGAVALNAVNLGLKVERWRLLLRSQGRTYSVGRAWVAYLSSSSVGMLTPGRVGDALRAQYLRHDLGVSYSEGLASVVMDRVCDLYVLAAFVVVGVYRFSAVVVGELAWIAWVGLFATVLAPLSLLVPGIAEAVVRRVYARALGSGMEAGGLAKFLEALRGLVRRPLAAAGAMTAAAFLVNYAQGFLLARALHLTISFFDMVCLMAIASLLGLIPISVSGVGVREVLFALVFPALGYGVEAGVGLGLLIFAAMYLAPIAAGFVSFQMAPPPSGPPGE